MKANKRFITVLLAALTIFVLVPTMAFAASIPGKAVKSWDAANMYATVTDVDDVTFDTNRDFNEESGLITATPVPKEPTVVGGDTYQPPVGSDGVTATACYYDLEGATFVYGSGASAKALDGTTWTQAAFAELALGVQLVEPSYTAAAQAAAKAGEKYTPHKATVAVAEGEATFGAWTLVVEQTKYDVTKTTEDQTITFKVKSLTPDSDVVIDGTTNADLFGTVAEATITVKGEAKTPETAGFYLDTVGGTAYNAGIYDGATHTVVVDPTPGWTVSYMVKNAATGKYEAASAVTITDVQEQAIDFYAVFKDEKGKAPDVKTPAMKLNLAAAITARPIIIGFDKAQSVKDDAFNYIVPGTEYDATTFIAYYAVEQDATPGETPEARAERIAKNETATKAVEANKALMQEYFNAKYELKDVSTKADTSANKVALRIAAKNLTSEEVAAVEKQYAQLKLNLGNFIVLEGQPATIQLNGDLIDDEIEFVDTPTAVTFKAKKLKKKAASFTVSAISNKGRTVNYKLIDAPEKITIDKASGEITLAKKLKKGTYKIKVKAYVPGMSLELYEYQNIKIKVKK